jgi:hypothetical protein
MRDPIAAPNTTKYNDLVMTGVTRLWTLSELSQLRVLAPISAPRSLSRVLPMIFRDKWRDFFSAICRSPFAVHVI